MPTTANSGPDVADLNPSLHQSLDALMSAVRQAGGSPVVTSGYRSYEKQAALYNSGNGGVPVAKPGTSLHEKGLAADVSGDSHTMSLLHTMAPKYGLVFPMANDPVHVQLAGTPAPGSSTPAAPGSTQPAGPMGLADRFNVLANMLTPGGSNTTATTAPNSAAPVPGTEVTISGTEADTSSAIDPSMGAPQTQTAAPNGGPAMHSTTQDGTGDIGRFMAALSGQESGGNYNAKNKDSGASGKYQIMPANWGSWSKDAGLPAGAPMTPENQELVVRHKVEQYYQQFGNWHDVAVAWYAGPGAVGKAKGNASQGAYPSINQYATSVLSRMNNG